MKTFVIALLGLTLGIFAQAQDTQKKIEKKAVTPATKPASITLKVGDPAPPLKVSKWMQGTEVASLEKGKIYVVDFWATWCGPCIVMMPHLGEMQREYKNQGVTIIGFSAIDPSNSEEKVRAFVEKRGPKLGYTFAFSDNRDTYKDWFEAAGSKGFPFTFVVDKAGNIAYLGHPMYLDVVLPKVAKGTWDPKVDGEKIKGIEKEVLALFRAPSGPDAAAGLAAFKDFEEKYPKVVNIPYFVGPKIRLLLKSGKKGEAVTMANKIMEKATQTDDSSMLGSVANTLIGADTMGDKDLAKVALASAEKMFAIVGNKDVTGNLTMARVLFANGKVSMAKEHAQATVNLAPDITKDSYRNMLKSILETDNP